eukprot:TRINITY_DN113094_c0_g1_i1.p1 TRINITY_DN113094_c0_g1~~TRINITY_DN113094_c0_g1_i1.p1  ORF type:complete len:323 (+),score=60.73 TRINITY_DN113094_c0_g1_i1:48-1016(+)
MACGAAGLERPCPQEELLGGSTRDGILQGSRRHPARSHVRRWLRAALAVASLALSCITVRVGLSAFLKVHTGQASLPTRRQLSLASVVGTSAAVAGGVLEPAIAEQPAANPEGDKRVNQFLKSVPVWVVTNAEGSPVLETDMSVERLGKKVAKFYMEPQGAADALKKMNATSSQKLEMKVLPLSDVYLPLVARGTEDQLGGQLRIEPLKKEVRHALQILSLNAPVGTSSLGPPGTVPLFMYPGLELQNPNGEAFTPAYLKEEDLKESVRRSGADIQGSRTQVALLQDIAEKLGTPEGPGAGIPTNIKVVASIGNVRDTRVAK